MELHFVKREEAMGCMFSHLWRGALWLAGASEDAPPAVYGQCHLCTVNSCAAGILMELCGVLILSKSLGHS